MRYADWIIQSSLIIRESSLLPMRLTDLGSVAISFAAKTKSTIKQKFIRFIVPIYTRDLLLHFLFKFQLPEIKIGIGNINDQFGGFTFFIDQEIYCPSGQ